jgi:hypothetical protein
VPNLYFIGSGWEAEEDSLDDTIAAYAGHCAEQEFGHYPDIEYISVFENCGDDEDMLPNELVKKYESDLHDAIEAAIRESKAESKFLSSMINDYKMGRV